MRLKLRYIRLGFVLIWSALNVTAANASFRPSFDLDQCSWNATHIVLVQTTAEDDVFSVLESWKGDLKPGDSVEVSGLKPDRNAVPLSKYPRSWELQFQDKHSEEIPRQPVGSRMILFLKKELGAASQWQPASLWGGMRVSALWMDGGNAFCFTQRMNPGPSALAECGNLAVLTDKVKQVLTEQRFLGDTLALKDADVRAERLGRIAMSDLYPAQIRAIDALGRSGVVALPAILQVMDHSFGFDLGSQVIAALVEAAGKDSGRQLHARLQQDLIYWKIVGPTLTQNWFGQLGDEGSPLYMKFSETVLLVRELNKENYTPATETVAELREFWVSQPQLYDSRWAEKKGATAVSGLDVLHLQLVGLVDDCDAFLKHTAAGNQR